MSTGTSLVTAQYPAKQPRKNSGIALPKKPIAYLRSFLCRPGMTNSQICSMSMGLERMRPT